MAAMIALEHLTGAPPGTAVALTRARFRSDDADSQDEGAPITPPASGTFTNLTQKVVPSATAQSVTVGTHSFVPGQFLLVDAGVDQQEAVAITAVADPIHLTAIFGKPHNVGDQLALVTASVSKVLRLNVTQLPTAGKVANVRFRQDKALPAGVYDQYRLVTVYAQGTGTPFVSDATHTYNRVPGVAEAYKPISGGPFSAVGPVSPMVEVQWLFTGAVSAMDSSAYRFVWDESDPSFATIPAGSPGW